MQRIQRLDLPLATQQALDRKQADADAKRAAGGLNVEATWKAARQTKPIKTALGVLQTMAGKRQRCMYCGDSHGADIEHFRPKRHHPDRMFRWLNLLLCCTECGRLKGDAFPMADGMPLMVDPTAENPWQFLDFDPATGNIVARFDPATNDWTRKGTETVKVLQLDGREAMAAGLQQTHRRLMGRVESALKDSPPDAITLAQALREADDHGLLGWYFSGSGQHEKPFASLRKNHPDVWQRLAGTIQSKNGS